MAAKMKQPKEAAKTIFPEKPTPLSLNFHPPRATTTFATDFNPPVNQQGQVTGRRQGMSLGFQVTEHSQVVAVPPSLKSQISHPAQTNSDDQNSPLQSLQQSPATTPGSVEPFCNDIHTST